MGERFASEAWQQKLKALIPSWGEGLGASPELLAQIRQRSNGLLGLNA